ncbi:hypothetical protein [Thiohalocapsa sp. ML1]|uniref:hypothetical protein n=1 Tax=Thiohalocapsa sp. ML1 TaxID=1431688 RepID=UPI0007322CD0|nr:hypothetical protein [Thiohalocapsa sp. ML1]
MPIDPSASSAAELASLIERLILEQQRLEPLELLLAAGALAYPDYEAWRLGQRAVLEDALRLQLADTLVLLQRAEEQARCAGLVGAPTDYRRWGDDAAPLHVGPSPALQRALATLYAPPPDRRQLDLFYDSGAVVAEETLREALLARRFGAARDACDRLRGLAPAHARLGDWQHLIDTLDPTARHTGPDASRVGAAALLHAIDAITPTAERLLGRRARDCLALLWAELADAADGSDFDPAAPRLHASHALAWLGRWPDVRAAVEAEPGWSDEPVLLERHGRACRLSGDHRAALGDWFALCWAYPDTAERLLAAGDFPDPRLAAHWVAFCDLDPPAGSAPPLETADFPAWCLLVEPGLAAEVPADQRVSDPGRATAYRAALALARAPDDVGRRRALGAAHPGLLVAFLGLRRAGG